MASDKIILVDKPAGWTSFDVVAKIRGKIRARYRELGEKPTKRQLRVGHTGTLDPFATGLLIILLGDETKRADEFLKSDKIYEATIHLGQKSTTGDPEGTIAEYSAARPTQAVDTSQEHEVPRPTLQKIQQVAARYTGEITQRPPIFSAIKINGKRAYQLARDGKEVELPVRKVTVYSLKIIDYTYPELRIRTHVSSGTYIRSLAVDIGEALGVGAYCKELRRTKVGQYDIHDAKTLDDVLA